MKKGLHWESDRLYIGRRYVGEVAKNGEYVCGSVWLGGRVTWAEKRRVHYGRAQRDTELLLVRLLQDYYCGARQLLAELGIEVPE